MSKTAREIFGVEGRTAKDIFARSGGPTPSAGRLFKARGFKSKDGPSTLTIRIKACGDCGFPTTSITRYGCAACHFRGWWWDEQKEERERERFNQG